MCNLKYFWTLIESDSYPKVCSPRCHCHLHGEAFAESKKLKKKRKGRQAVPFRN